MGPSFARYAYRALPGTSVVKAVDAVLPQIADYRPPVGMQAGSYALKTSCFDEYDAFYTHLTPKFHAEARERWLRHRATAKSSKPRPPCPPLPDTSPAYARIRGLLLMPQTVTIVRRVLAEALCQADADQRCSEDMLASALHLLALMVHHTKHGGPAASELAGFVAAVCERASNLPGVEGASAPVSLVELLLKLEAQDTLLQPAALESVKWALARLPKVHKSIKAHQNSLPGGKRKSSKKKQKKADAEKRKREKKAQRVKAAQARALAMMAKKQTQFAAALDGPKVGDGDASDQDDTQAGDDHGGDAVCILCHEHREEPVAFIGLAESSKVVALGLANLTRGPVGDESKQESTEPTTSATMASGGDTGGGEAQHPSASFGNGAADLAAIMAAAGGSGDDSDVEVEAEDAVMDFGEGLEFNDLDVGVLHRGGAGDGDGSSTGASSLEELEVAMGEADAPDGRDGAASRASGKEDEGGDTDDGSVNATPSTAGGAAGSRGSEANDNHDGDDDTSDNDTAEDGTESFTARAARLARLAGIPLTSFPPNLNPTELMAVLDILARRAGLPRQLGRASARSASAAAPAARSPTVKSVAGTAGAFRDGMREAQGVQVQFCGHMMHPSCSQTHRVSLMNKVCQRKGGVVVVAGGSFLCLFRPSIAWPMKGRSPSMPRSLSSCAQCASH